jgi:hypothetical protein
MKFFIVDNGTALLEDIILRITDEGYDYDIQKYSPYAPLRPKRRRHNYTFWWNAKRSSRRFN